tara:strand:- start:745 stop:888 length:144 start_codon:yes stop_codon:yes gene_type:complete
MKIEIDIAKLMRRESRKARLPQGGRHGTRKGKRGYTRKVKHPHREDK